METARSRLEGTRTRSERKYLEKVKQTLINGLFNRVQNCGKIHRDKLTSEIVQELLNNRFNLRPGYDEIMYMVELAVNNNFYNSLDLSSIDEEDLLTRYKFLLTQDEEMVETEVRNNREGEYY